MIGRCVQSVRDLIDSWVICDTGSTDDTQQIITNELRDIPGELYERPWHDFGENRSELMQLADGRGDYLLLLDADMTVTFEKSKLGKLSADSYLLRHDEPVEYWIKRLVRSDRQWRYVGATHEYVTTCGTDHTERLDAILVTHHADGGTRAEKFERDLRLLSKELRDDPTNSRAVFYLANTHRDLGHQSEAIELYRRRIAMGGWEEEIFYSIFQVGVLKAEQGAWPAARRNLMRAWEFRPSRLEPLYELVSRLRSRREHEAAHRLAQRGLERPQPEDILFVCPWVYRWGLLFEYSIAAYWVGEPQAALDACNRLLAMSDLPDAYRQQTVINRNYCLRRLITEQLQTAPVIAGAKGQHA